MLECFVESQKEDQAKSLRKIIEDFSLLLEMKPQTKAEMESVYQTLLVNQEIIEEKLEGSSEWEGIQKKADLRKRQLMTEIRFKK